MSYSLSQYLSSIDKWMKYYGYTQYTPPAGLGIEKMFWKKTFEASRFGNVNTYCFVKYSKNNADGTLLRSYSAQMFEYASGIRKGGPLGIGNMLVVFPLLVTDNILQELYTSLKNYCPKHFAAAEFPSVLDLNSGNLYYYEDTPVWGSLYYNGYRADSYTFFSPNSWKSVSEKPNSPA